MPQRRSLEPLRVAAWIGGISLLLLAAGCQRGGCGADADCKGSRVCEAGRCVEARPAGASPSAAAPSPGSAPALDASAAPSTTAAPSAPLAAAPSASAAPPCADCRTQEDFDAAATRGQRCCPVTACRGDVDCPRGRVCCRIPSGQLCADARRCAEADHVRTREERCAATCRDRATPRCYCACMGQCPEP